MRRSATLPSAAARFDLANPYNAACVRGPAAEFTPQEIRENAVLRGSRSEEAVRFVDIGSEKTALAAAFRRHGFGSRSIWHAATTYTPAFRNQLLFCPSPPHLRFRGTAFEFSPARPTACRILLFVGFTLT